MTLRILVLGAGATGGYFGGRLAQAAQQGKADVDVRFLVRPARAERLRRDGLRVRTPDGGFALPVHALLHTELEPVHDLVLLSCKAYDLESSILAVYPGLHRDTLVLPLLNGLAHFERLDREFGAARVVGGCCHIAGRLAPDGAVEQLTALERITFGARPANAAHAGAVLAALEAAFRATPVGVKHSADVLQDIWDKFVMLATLAGMTCLMRAAVGDIAATDDGRALTLRMLDECLAAARHAGHPMAPEVRDATAAMLTSKGSAFSASMLRDLEGGGPTEGAHIVGDMLARARAAGSDAAMLASAWTHLQARDARVARERGSA
ncbi:MAG: ketopantoate reductase family protein [Burkholderiales bacterium]|nr:ketopantoate reductase family protein [Burkholderiales bacterium]